MTQDPKKPSKVQAAPAGMTGVRVAATPAAQGAGDAKADALKLPKLGTDAAKSVFIPGSSRAARSAPPPAAAAPPADNDIDLLPDSPPDEPHSHAQSVGQRAPIKKQEGPKKPEDIVREKLEAKFPGKKFIVIFNPAEIAGQGTYSIMVPAALKLEDITAQFSIPQDKMGTPVYEHQAWAVTESVLRQALRDEGLSGVEAIVADDDKLTQALEHTFFKDESGKRITIDRIALIGVTIDRKKVPGRILLDNIASESRTDSLFSGEVLKTRGKEISVIGGGAKTITVSENRTNKAFGIVQGTQIG